MSRQDDFARAERSAQLSAMESVRGVRSGPIDLGSSDVTGVTAIANGGTGRTTLLPDVQIFGVSGTWTKPDGVRLVLVRCLPSDAPSVLDLFEAASLPGTVAVTVADGTVGHTDTSFGAFLTATGIPGEIGNCIVASW